MSNEQQPQQQLSEQQQIMMRQSMFQVALDAYNNMCKVLLTLPIHPNTLARQVAFMELEGAILRFKEMMANGPLHFSQTEKKTENAQVTKSEPNANDGQPENQLEANESKPEENKVVN